MTTARACQHPHDLGHQNPSTPGRGAQPGCLDDRGAEAVRLLEDDVPCADPDPHLQRHVARTRPVAAVESLLNRHGGGQGVGRSGEGGHHAVTEVLDQPPPVRLDRARDQPVVVPAKLIGCVLAEPGAEFGRLHQIREENDGGRPAGTVRQRLQR
jgi:hypothetical protein